MKRSILFLFLLVTLSCERDDIDIDGEVKVFGHGGYGIGQSYPMNTVESMLACFYSGADGTEIDVQMTKDSILIALHPYDLSESTNLYGKAIHLTWAEIQEAFYTDNPYLHYGVASLEQIIEALHPLGSFMLSFDCKMFSEGVPHYNEVLADKLLDLIDRYNIGSNIIIESPDISFLNDVKGKNTALNLAFYAGYEINAAIGVVQVNGFKGIVTPVDAVNEEQVEEIMDLGIEVTLFNAHSHQRNRDALEKEPTYIQTDNVAHLLDLLGDD